ncbi:N-acetyltransferase ESCO2 [Striga asiatica]|uniref:N-acetyltransferase ESCO2 n=1 Tax=Striga asiatica TaxID=4170 RepID=A0A5A7P8A6_STRAF|nr:N-acetyltransferase ESCO2 [Striga asiatica]
MAPNQKYSHLSLLPFPKVNHRGTQANRSQNPKPMQPKINTFFKPSPSPSRDLWAALPQDSSPMPEITVTYKRQTAEQLGEVKSGSSSQALEKSDCEDKLVKWEHAKCSKNLNKKRNYAQLHLEVGQSNFLWRTCTTCSYKYAPGVEGDEKAHKTFHRNYTHGVPFKGWRSERIIDAPEKGRIILVQEGDPPSQQNKVQEVVQMMEMELGEGWIMDKHCKVYLFISSQRVTGCLVTEPIKKAYRIVSSSKGEDRTVSAKRERKSSTALQFGSVNLQREIVKRDSIERIPEEGSFDGMILREDEAVPAICGIRAIWVTPCNRRKHIASNLLDAARKSFCKGLILDHMEVAFSQPTSLGKALISSYTRTSSFLVYTTADTD